MSLRGPSDEIGTTKSRHGGTTLPTVARNDRNDKIEGSRLPSPDLIPQNAGPSQPARSSLLDPTTRGDLVGTEKIKTG
jgi:hypothetical protein